jgi:hypothetical protein
MIDRIGLDASNMYKTNGSSEESTMLDRVGLRKDCSIIDGCA